jgi:hypothetical protein
VSKLEGLGWIEYMVPIRVPYYPQLLIEVNFIDMVYFLLIIQFPLKQNIILFFNLHSK